MSQAEATLAMQIQAIRLPKPERDCRQCGAPYSFGRSHRIYCSRKCASAAWRIRSYPYTHLACGICGEDFVRLHSNQRYCSDVCGHKADSVRRKRRNTGIGKGGLTRGAEFVPRKNCILCGNRFYAPPALVRRGGGKYCSNGCRVRAMAMNPENYPQTRSRRGLGGKRSDLGDKYFRSSWEANWARYLNLLVSWKQIREWKYEPVTYEFVGIKRGTKFYTPDFLVTENNGGEYFYEIKGYMDQRSETKLKRMKKYHPKVEIRLIQQKEYKSIEKQVSTLIPTWERRR